ncbi:MAG: hypothetical protein A2268_02795 [Candidatus Raymondbacteria bacterium RifOxyA12_full_50_37]|uniref:Magnesium transporter MgtE intracellular domain-containing protein n=1 Tax=Candidatus Raymondbacteria bacterium RIFOXYD12_FULL_49_13 TaxID=1817890 RepID=A0A1F7F277_UNCRA|nr:MAG: hypothetical protein A2268_02795 [Candidatus Raymondbacteria bacterium RifOxyA12_full_50_37]OGJ85911.1 MAG: hypothetical protein A2248_15560 [Candidatus Raymondbacteria bacterium RIFOXYA2_FULL_49_16]OGJ91489.1 MAG: hypothetical protein A2350_02785 [Candidatus Raymondbacteria bacterium RifOxyB12_full_50_8]OGJ95905.1 MAG: hypothetical protein A2453_01120 [Candidatus Raymondbacteria bacterium RIFOXYC2_FULL_50_21]OGJ99577.1 MAG: hypothetical protein A2487_02335 [Candidatus Raymondbacteria b
MKLKDIIIIAAVATGLFPIVLLIAMYATGFLSFSYGWTPKKPKEETVKTIEYSAYQESLAVVHTKAFKAFELQRAEIAEKERKIAEDEERLTKLKKEISIQTEDLNKTRLRLEELVTQSKELEDRRIKQLSSIYGSMRSEEAAPILFTLKNELIVQIMRKMGDDRAKAKLMAAMGSISKERTGAISKMMASTTGK